MKMKTENPLAECGKPLFFPVGNFSELNLRPPNIRRDDAVRLWARSLTVMQKEAVVVSAKTGQAWRMASDEGAYLNGFDAAPCPLSFMTVGMVSSFMNEVVALAKRRGIDPSNIRLTLDNFYTMKGSMLKGTMTGGALNPKLRLDIQPPQFVPAIPRNAPPMPMDNAPADKEALRALVCDAVKSAPVNGLLRGENHSLFSLSRNGVELKPDKVSALDFHLPDNTARVGDAIPDKDAPRPPPQLEVISKIGMTEKTDEDTSAQGSSLREAQNRQLHVQGACALLDDKGMKKIEQRLFNPRGSVFQFLSDESPENGGGGRAPDAHSYIAAGLGFCFMTQFGRYAKIVRKALSAYNIAQDLHFSAGGERAGRTGGSDPAETHVYLTTGEGDDFARAALDVGERTCFLHALCRADLHADVGVGGRE